MASGEAPRKIVFTFCNLLRDVRDEKRKPKPWPSNNFFRLATFRVNLYNSMKKFTTVRRNASENIEVLQILYSDRCLSV